MRNGAWSELQSLGVLLAMALVIRLACAVVVQRHLDHGSREVCLIPGDADGYWILAGKIARGEDYAVYERRVLRMPGFPAVLAIPRFVAFDNLLLARAWLAVVGTAGCWFTYLLGRELHSGAAGLWAAAVTALSPVLSLFSVLLLSETAFAVALTASLYLAVRLYHRLNGPALPSEPWWAFFTGVVFAVATFMRPTWLLIGPIAAALLWPWISRRRFRAALLIGVGLFGSLLPWGYRNLSVTGHFTLTTFWVGPSLYDGLNPEATGDSNMAFFDREQLLSRMSEYDMDREYRRRAWAYAAEHPVRTVELMVIKLWRYWSLWPNAAQFRAPWQQAIVFISFLLILVPALFATWQQRHDRKLLLVTWGPILYFAAIHMLFVGSIRYRLPAEYPFAVLAGMGWMEWVRKSRH